MNMTAPMTDKERELKYQTEEDARILTKAFEIKRDAQRLRRALTVVSEQARDANAAQLDIRQMLRRLAGANKS